MELRVISFNIRCCDDWYGNSIAERAPRLAQVTKRYMPDIMGFQEYRPDWMPHLLEHYGEEFEIYLKHRCEIDKEAVPILWRKDKFECLKQGYFWFSDTPEVESKGWDELYDCYRICTYVILREKQTGKELAFFSTHFGFGDAGQVRSAKLLKEYSNKISDLPTIVVGDFNMAPDSPGHQEMEKHFADVNTVTVNDLGTTFHNYTPETIETEHIDYCFVSPEIKALDQQIIRDRVDGMFPSDHFGLFALLDIE